MTAVFCSLYPKANAEIQHDPKYKVHDVLAKRKYNCGCFLLGYVITLNWPTRN